MLALLTSRLIAAFEPLFGVLNSVIRPSSAGSLRIIRLRVLHVLLAVILGARVDAPTRVLEAVGDVPLLLLERAVRVVHAGREVVSERLVVERGIKPGFLLTPNPLSPGRQSCPPADPADGCPNCVRLTLRRLTVLRLAAVLRLQKRREGPQRRDTRGDLFGHRI